MSYSLSRRDVLVTGAIATAFLSANSADCGEAPLGRESFNFLHGSWAVRHRQLRRRLAGSQQWFEFPGTLEVQPILGGVGNFDRNELRHPGGSYEAHSLRLYDAALGRWSIWWLDSRAPDLGQPVVGSFSGLKGSFYSDETYNEKPIRIRTTYEPLPNGDAQWTQAFSPDGGTYWEVNWIMDFRRPA